MPVIQLQHASGRSDIYCERGLLGQQPVLSSLIPSRALIVTDRTVADLYLAKLESALAAFDYDTLILPDGEAHKTLDNWYGILNKLAMMGAQRDATIIALGGGVIGDMAGFAAASYMRGIRVIQMPTTLLAQVDASVGGKTGVNLPQGKNLVGAFHQPGAVLIDVDTLNTQQARDYSAGLAEVVKYAAIRDAEFMQWLELNQAAIMGRRADVLIEMIVRSVRHKAEVVEADEREQGQRALLNFGHTFGHALETATEYHRYRHGEAVAIGMLLAAKLSARLSWIPQADVDRLKNLLLAFDLPIDVPEGISAEQLLELMQLDKKNRAGRLRLVLLKALGHAIVADDIEEHDVLAVLG